jgi:hypothetical protein
MRRRDRGGEETLSDVAGEDEAAAYEHERILLY